MQLRQSRMGDGCGKAEVSGNYKVGFMELPKRETIIITGFYNF